MLNWPSAFVFMHDFVFEDGDLEWMEASAGVERRRCPRG